MVRSERCGRSVGAEIMTRGALTRGRNKGNLRGRKDEGWVQYNLFKFKVQIGAFLNKVLCFSIPKDQYMHVCFDLKYDIKFVV